MKPGTIKLSMAMQAIASRLDKEIEYIAGERIGFALIVFTEVRPSYIATMPRDGAIHEIKRLIAQMEGRVDTGDLLVS